MSTILDLLDDDDENPCLFPCEIDGNLSGIILDLSQDLNLRIEALNLCSSKGDDEVMELLCRINGMYQMSGIRTVEMYLYSICVESDISPMLKLTAAKSLIEYRELTDEDDSEDEKIQIAGRNRERLMRSGKALEHVCERMGNLPTPCRVEALEHLMTYDMSRDNALKYFQDLIGDQSIECEFRYKTILGLEKLAEVWLKKKLEGLFGGSFVGILFELCKGHIKSEFPGFVPTVDNQAFFELLVGRQSYIHCRDLYSKHVQMKLPCVYDYFIHRAQYHFLFTDGNMVYYKILAAQYLLQHCIPTDGERVQIEGELVRFAEDGDLDYDRRADSADVLLQLGSAASKARGRAIIILLGREEGGSMGISTVFSNAQNVHTTEVENSVAEILEFFAMLPLHLVQKKPVEFDYVRGQIQETLRRERPIGGEDVPTEREDAIIMALNRISMDRVLYSKYNNTLSNVLMKVWSYLKVHESGEEMYVRLLEELEEMSGTCSTGFVSRMVNVVSGFGEFSLRISWEDQIVANLSGRLNAVARSIMDPDSPYRDVHLEAVMGLWLNGRGQETVRGGLVNRLQNEAHEAGGVVPTLTLNDVVEAYIDENMEERVEEALEAFSTAVLDEMSVSTLNGYNRLNFGLFFRSSVAGIREEMYREFTEHLDDTSFDLYMRKAIMHYEGVM